MPSLFPVITRIDMTRLNRGLQLAQGYTRRTPAEACNTAGTEIAIATKNDLPFVTTGKIDTELNVISVPKIGVRGKPLKNKKTFVQKTGEGAGAPVAALIIQAASNSSSRFNELTGFRWFGPSPFKGVSRAVGARLMALAIAAMTSRRHSSGHFLQASWIPAVKKMLPFSVNKYRRGSSTGAALEGNSEYYGADLGDAHPAATGQTTAVATIESDLGMVGKQSASITRAQWTIAAPLLQEKVNNEGRKQMEYFLDKQSKAELFGPVNAAWK